VLVPVLVLVLVLGLVLVLVLVLAGVCTAGAEGPHATARISQD
jgi:hypothetical protein